MEAGDVATLVEALNAPTVVCCEAEAMLKAIGPDAVPALLDALPRLSATALLHALDVFAEVADPRTYDAVIGLLGHDDDRVRQWAAYAVADFGLRDAVPALRRAWQAAKEAGTPLGWSEPAALRGALTLLGAREPVVPPRVRALTQPAHVADVVVIPIADLRTVVDELAAHGQAVLGVGFTTADGRTSWYTPYAELPDPDPTLPWADVVATAHAAAVAAAVPRDATHARVDWAGEADR